MRQRVIISEFRAKASKTLLLAIFATVLGCTTGRIELYSWQEVALRFRALHKISQIDEDVFQWGGPKALKIMPREDAADELHPKFHDCYIAVQQGREVGGPLFFAVDFQHAAFYPLCSGPGLYRTSFGYFVDTNLCYAPDMINPIIIDDRCANIVKKEFYRIISPE